MGIGKVLLLLPLVLGLNGCLGLWALDAVMPEEDEPEQVAEVIAEPAPEPEAESEAEPDYLAQGKQQGYEAAVAAQNAEGAEWGNVAEKWGAALVSLVQVPTDSPNYAEAQAKVTEYKANQRIARQREAAFKAKSTPAVAPPQLNAWQLSPGWKQMQSEEGKALAYLPRSEVISCQDEWVDYCFEFDIMAQEGCPRGLYVEGQLIDPNTDVVVGMGNDSLPALLPGQVGRISINTQGPAKISWSAKCY